MTSELASKQCVPCRGDTPPLTEGQYVELLAKLDDGWTVESGHHLTKRYTFSDFVTALRFVNAVGAIAEEQGHHPDLTLTWGKVAITIWTHAIDGLTESDFVLAAKADAAFAPGPSA